jgi:hypothetical protein
MAPQSPASQPKPKSQPKPLEPKPMMAKDGTKGRCQVLVKSSGFQCQNPANYPLAGTGFTICHTHLNRMASPNYRARARFTKTNQAYNASLWGLAKPEPKPSPKTQPKPKTKPSPKPSQSQPAPSQP